MHGNRRAPGGLLRPTPPPDKPGGLLSPFPSERWRCARADVAIHARGSARHPHPHRASCSLQRSLRCTTQPGTPARCKSEAWLLVQSLQMSAESVYPAPPPESELSDEDVPLLFNDAPLSEVIHARADPSPPSH